MDANTNIYSGPLVDKLSEQSIGYGGISYEYIRGLVDGEGCFTFYPAKVGSVKYKIPAFVLAMSERDADLLRLVADKLGVKSKIYVYPPRKRRDGYKRQGMAVLIIRSIGQIKNVIVPLFYKKLHGYKGKQFEAWIEQMGNDEAVSNRFRLVHKLYKVGFYDKNHSRFWR